MASNSISTPERSDRRVIGYLAFSGMLLALGIDTALPAYDLIAPAMGLDADSSRITLIITVYFFGTAAGQLLWGPVADRFGRINAMTASVGLYVVAALASALAPNLTFLMIARVVWGLGAAGPAVLRPTIARDLYEGDEMARIMALVMAIFMAGPIMAPLIGEAILLVGSWRLIFLFCAVAGVVQMGWTRRFGETLNPADVRPLNLSATWVAFRKVLTTRATVSYTMALAFSYGSFFIYLGSTQRIMAGVYDLGDWFAVTFAASGLVLGAAFFGINRLIQAFGARRVSIAGMVGFVSVGVLHLVHTLIIEGEPKFWMWLLAITAMNLLGAALGPSCFTLGLEPMGELAGTASAVMGFLTIAIGAGMAALINEQIAASVTPMAVGYLVYGTIALSALVVAKPIGSAKPS